MVLRTTDGGVNWTQETSGTTERLMDVYFITPDTGWTVGYNGIILKTVNGGDHWTQETSGTTERLRSIFFSDQNNGWAVGDNGTMLNFTGGSKAGTWTQTTSGTTERLHSVQFPTSGLGWICGDNNTILKSMDSGINWTQETSGSTERLLSVNFPTDNMGWIVGGNGVILKFEMKVDVSSPTDGDNWQVGTKEDIEWSKLNVNLLKLEYSTNNGANWNIIADSIPAMAKSYKWDIPDTISTQCIVKISNSTNAGLFDNSDGNFEISKFIILTPNGGENWESQNLENITWMKGNRDTVNLQFSVDTGATWNIIADSIPASQCTFSWDIPDTNSVYCLVKISDTKDSLMYDISDTTFTITVVSNYEITNGGIEMNVYPNPSNGMLTLNIEEEISGKTKIQITDLSGRLIEQISIDKKQISIDMSKYQKGIYLLKIVSGNKSRTEKIVVW